MGFASLGHQCAYSFCLTRMLASCPPPRASEFWGLLELHKAGGPLCLLEWHLTAWGAALPSHTALTPAGAQDCLRTPPAPPGLCTWASRLQSSPGPSLGCLFLFLLRPRVLSLKFSFLKKTELHSEKRFMWPTALEGGGPRLAAASAWLLARASCCAAPDKAEDR